MSEKRKDHKGRILRTGESQRKDLIYQYRYTDIQGKRQTIYSSDLKELREKEKEIQKQLDEGIDYAAGKVTVIALVERYISLKQGMRYNTKVGYNFVLNLIKKEDFGYRQIRDIKVSDAQQWIMKLHSDGKGYSTITSVRGVVKPAFQMAYNEDIKTLQYVMGHSDVGVTLNVYTHASYDRAAEQMAKIIDFKGTVTPEKQRKSG